ncbi:hypothetical protein JD844_000303 [Phrynosoma platyrhinos]|uniref:C-factor n=1 Tax=Phrynosoma platyrhinos TaxID=52577 RepID=A0ABQ7SQM5_PHRPL|nr:hypothetical protein JD844_000303 [Phrynosoma platyrhinos]
MAVLKAHSVLVTGSNRGIGLGLVRQLLGKNNHPEKIFATCRDPEGPGAQNLRNLAAKHQEVKIIQLDASDPTSIKNAAARVSEQLKGTGLNLLINNAAIGNSNTLDSETPEAMAEVYKTNVTGPLVVSQAFLPLLKKAAQKSPQKGMSCNKAAIVNISSEGGSITNVLMWHFVQTPSYRCSKAALNMLTKCQSLGYVADEILCIAVHPGWVQTDMGSAKASLPVDVSVREILNTLAHLSEKDNGTFVNWEGKAVPCILVTGSNRGIGLELVRQLIEGKNQPEWIFATCRDPDGPHAQELRNLAAKHQGVKIIQLDTTDLSSIKAAVATATEQLKEAGLNLLVNNAGILKLNTQETLETMSETYETNVIGPMIVSQEFLPLLKKASQKSPHKGMNCSKAAIVNISSEGGSITRAALNMLTKCQSLEFVKDDILCIAVHPGWVETDMGKSVGQPPLTVEFSVKEILNTLAHLSEKDNGTFVDWEGKVVPCLEKPQSREKEAAEQRERQRRSRNCRTSLPNLEYPRVRRKRKERQRSSGKGGGGTETTPPPSQALNSPRAGRKRQQSSGKGGRGAETAPPPSQALNSPRVRKKRQRSSRKGGGGAETAPPLSQALKSPRAGGRGSRAAGKVAEKQKLPHLPPKPGIGPELGRRGSGAVGKVAVKQKLPHLPPKP